MVLCLANCLFGVLKYCTYGTEDAKFVSRSAYTSSSLRHFYAQKTVMLQVAYLVCLTVAGQCFDSESFRGAAMRPRHIACYHYWGDRVHTKAAFSKSLLVHSRTVHTCVPHENVVIASICVINTSTSKK